MSTSFSSSGSGSLLGGLDSIYVNRASRNRLRVSGSVRLAKNMPWKKSAVLQFQLVTREANPPVCTKPAETENSGQGRESADTIVMLCANSGEGPGQGNGLQ